jgi:hypothetical protein
MTRTLKVLALTLFAASAMSALAASAAQATEGAFSWTEGTTKLIAETDPASPSHILTVTPGAITASFTCDEFTGEATVTGAGSTNFTLQKIVYSDSGTTPSTGECTGKVNSIALKVPVKPNECDYKFTTGSTLGTMAAGRSEGTVHIECPAGKEIEVTAAGCLVKIGPQVVGPVIFQTITTAGGREHITSEAKIGIAPGSAHENAIDYSTSGITCGIHNETDGTYVGNTTFTGFTKSGTSTNATVT